MSGWDEFYSENMTPPNQKRTRELLQHIPKNVDARVLDFGSGNGRWSSAFHRDRKDIIIDLIDWNAPYPSLIPRPWKGELLEKTDFRDFTPVHAYSGIWANNVLFFLEKETIATVFHRLANTLVDNGTLIFTMIQANDTIAHPFSSLSKEEITSMLAREKLTLSSITLENAEYALESDASKKIPTFHVTAKKRMHTVKNG